LRKEKNAMSKTPISKHEIEEMITAKLKPRRSDLARVGLVRGATGWSCMLTMTGPSTGPVGEANAELAQLLSVYTIVDKDGDELDGKMR
jgi:hypothetical protein